MDPSEANAPRVPGGAVSLLALVLAVALLAFPMAARADETVPSPADGAQVGVVGESADDGDGAPVSAGAEEGVPFDGSGEVADDVPDDLNVPDDPDVSDDAMVQSAGRELVTLRLAEGVRDFDRARAVVDALNGASGESAAALAMDRRLQDEAFQRSAEISIWLSDRRPSGLSRTSGGTEFRFFGRDAEPATVAAQLAEQVDLAAGRYRSIGVGCWDQDGERFYVAILSTRAASSSGAEGTGTEPWSPEVEVDLGGATSELLTNRLRAHGYRSVLPMVAGTTRAVWFTWTTAPAEGERASASGLPEVAIDPSSFAWASSDESVAEVSPAGVVTMHATSLNSPAPTSERGADITVSLPKTERTLEFHVSASVPVYRLYNPYDHAHLYTTSYNEYQTLPRRGWKAESVCWQSPWSPAEDGEIAATPIYRLYNPYSGDHHFTADTAENDGLAKAGWRKEGVAYYSDGALDGQPIYRLYNSYQTAKGGLGSHLWTTGSGEYDRLGQAGWTQEGTAFFGVRSDG